MLIFLLSYPLPFFSTFILSSFFFLAILPTSLLSPVRPPIHFSLPPFLHSCSSSSSSFLSPSFHSSVLPYPSPFHPSFTSLIALLPSSLPLYQYLLLGAPLVRGYIATNGGVHMIRELGNNSATLPLSISLRPQLPQRNPCLSQSTV